MRISKLIFVLALMTFLFNKRSFSQSIDPMNISCVQVNPVNGDVVLNFFPINIIGANASFDSLRIYYSNNKFGNYTFLTAANCPNCGNYSLIQASGISVNLPTFSNANNQPFYFYSVVSYSVNGTPGLLATSDTVSSIFLSQTYDNLGLTNLNWNPIRNPLSLTSSTTYNLNRSFYEFTSPLFNITTPQPSVLFSANTSYTDTLIKFCDDSIYYFVEIQDLLTGCYSKSNLVRFYFTTPGPNAPVVKYATKNTFDNTLMEWFPSTSTFADGYYVYKLGCNGPIKVDSLLSYNSVVYNDNDTTPICSECTNLRVAAFNECTSFIDQHKVKKVGQPSTFNNSINISHSFSTCDYRADISWCRYKDFSAGVKEYRIWASINGGPEVQIGTVDSSKSSFTYTTGKDSALYVFRVEALDRSGNYSSYSFIDSLIADVPKLPIELFLKYVSVRADGFVEGNFTNDTLAELSHYMVYRGYSADGPFDELIDSIPFHLHKDTLKFVDTTALTSEMSYYYKVMAYDVCKNLSNVSKIAKTVLLSVNPELNFSSEMSWSNYEGWISGVNYYEVFRSYSNRFQETMVKRQLVDSGFAYVDDISDSLNPTGYYCYRVMAVSTYDSIHYEVDSSYSNFVCIREQPHIWVPNAFTPPDGYNPIFKPEIIFIPSESYELRIYDRWGTCLTTINDINKGWDGTYKSKDCPIGIYTWQIRYKNMKNEFKYLNGMVNLIR
jgi:gliding motility-associated-like protein